MFIPVTQTPVEIKNVIVTVTIMLSPGLLQPPVVSACFLEAGVPIHTITTGSVPEGGVDLICVSGL